MITFIKQLFCKHNYKLYDKDSIHGSKFVCIKCKKITKLFHEDIIQAHKNIVEDIKMRIVLGDDIPMTDKKLKIDCRCSTYNLYGNALAESIKHWESYGYDIMELNEK